MEIKFLGVRFCSLKFSVECVFYWKILIDNAIKYDEPIKKFDKSSDCVKFSFDPILTVIKIEKDIINFLAQSRKEMLE